MNSPLLLQEFYVRVAATAPVSGTELLRAMLRHMPEQLQTIEFGDIENSPAVWEDALRRFAAKRGWQIVMHGPDSSGIRADAECLIRMNEHLPRPELEKIATILDRAGVKAIVVAGDAVTVEVPA